MILDFLISLVGMAIVLAGLFVGLHTKYERTTFVILAIGVIVMVYPLFAAITSPVK